MSAPARRDPKVLVSAPRGPVHGIAVVLHGGRDNSMMRVRWTQLAVLRMRPFVWSLRRAGRSDGLVVAQVRYRVRGWNGPERSPVADTEWALDQLAARFPDVPIALVGHSMGGRTAMYVAGHDRVRAVVGLAPWLEPDDPVTALAGRRVLIAHGDSDRMTNPRTSAAFARAAEKVAESVSYVSVAGEKHAMLQRPRLWHELATGFVLGVIFDRRPTGTKTDQTSNVLTRALAGQAALVV
jgi:alpha-beta hydrolase superfamily lysophospholipase